MPTPLTDAINALTRYANETTGQSDTNLSDAVATLVEGYGQGGGSYSYEDAISGKQIATYTSQATSIRADNFGATASGIDKLVLPNVTNIADYGFRKCDANEIHFPNMDTARNWNGIFYQCNASHIYLPKLETFGLYPRYAFAECANLVSIAFPSLTNLGTNPDNMFRMCSSLEAIDYGENCVARIAGSSTYYNCTVLTKIIIRRTTGVNSLGNLNSFQNTPFADGKSGGTLYVPQDLIASYQSATNWSTILGYANNQILPIEGSIYETQYADGTPIE